MKLLSIVLNLAAAALQSLVQATDYCSPKLCPNDSPHIACNNSGAFSSTCPARVHLLNMAPYVYFITHTHNTNRNHIASGKMHGYLPAKCMATMRWDSELAAMAKLNVMQCAKKRDSCHNTDAFNNSGQNVGIFGYSGPKDGYTTYSLILNRIDFWWDENRACKMDYIKAYPRNYQGDAINSFTLMAAQSNRRVGCAVSRWFDGNFNRFLIACNYATNNIIGNSTYKSGSPASACKTGKNRHYQYLCSENEKY